MIKMRTQKRVRHLIEGIEPIQNLTKKKNEETQVKVYIYNEEKYYEIDATNLEKLPKKLNPEFIYWIDVVGIRNKEALFKIGDNFELHPLVIEDIYDTNQRLKIDYFEQYIYFVFKSFSKNELEENILEQISIILGKNFVITFQEYLPNQFNPIIEKIKEAKGKIRKMRADYLAYNIIDLLIDDYFSLLEKFGEDIDFLEQELISNPDSKTLKGIYRYKQTALIIRKSIWPLREAISGLTRAESELFSGEIALYFSDVYDHVIQIIDSLEIYREILSEMIDIYLSSLSNKMNQIMKVLTIVSTIFIPLTFIASLYGMNFTEDPPLPPFSLRFGWILIVGVMVLIGIGMIVVFRKKKWL